MKQHQEYTLAKQILRSGTSIGANIEEARGGYSTKDFIARLGISYKESRETKYWLKLLHATNYISKEEFESLFADADELGKILYKIIQKAKANIKK